MRKLLAVVMFLLVAPFVLSACGTSSAHHEAKEEVDKRANRMSPYLPNNDVEMSNYNKAQKLYDSPDTIIWCSVMPQASTAPILTVPVAGKLTSSSTTFFNPMERKGGSDGAVALPTRSVDGLYHPNPPQYRYGFTPGDQYVDFYNLPTFCSTKPMDFQKESIAVKVDDKLNDATERASKALKDGDHAKAERILVEASGE